MTSGIYLITNTVTGDTYVGRSTNIEARFTYGHLGMLKKGRHKNPKMTQLYADTGENAFVLSVLEECSKYTSVFSEERWIKKLKPTINVLGKELSEINRRSVQQYWARVRKQQAS
jgi:group I intron endonuclease